jgi:hypothetical protein
MLLSGERHHKAMNEHEPEDTPFPRGIPQPAIRAFVREGYSSLESIAGASKAQLLALHGVGPKAIRGLQEALESRGLPPLTE